MVTAPSYLDVYVLSIHFPPTEARTSDWKYGHWLLMEYPELEWSLGESS